MIISDVHGDDRAFIKSLWIAYSKVVVSPTLYSDFLASFSPPYAARPLDDRNEILLVQMGDLIDRGRFGKRCVEIAGLIPRVIGWETRILYGNHDLSTLLGFPYANMVHSNEDIGRDSGGLAKGSSLWDSIVSNQLLLLRIKGDEESNGSSLFVHAGGDTGWLEEVFPDYHLRELDEMNEYLQSVLMDGPATAREAFLDRKSPVMTRNFSNEDQSFACLEVDEILFRFGVDRVFVGHTPMRTRRVMSRCGGRVIFTDVGMSRWMHPRTREIDDLEGGFPSAIVMNVPGTIITAYYVDTVDGSSVFEEPIHDLDQYNEWQKMDQNKENGASKTDETTRRKRTRTSEKFDPSLGRVILVDDFMTVYRSKKREEGLGGLLVEFADFDQPRSIKELLEGLHSFEAIPKVHLKGFNTAALSLDANQIFIETKSCDTLLINHHMKRVDDTILHRIVEVTQNVHKAGKCVGYETAADRMNRKSKWFVVMSFFSANEAVTEILLINFSLIHDCNDSKSQLSEMSFILNTLKKVH